MLMSCDISQSARSCSVYTSQPIYLATPFLSVLHNPFYDCQFFPFGVFGHRLDLHTYMVFALRCTVARKWQPPSILHHASFLHHTFFPNLHHTSFRPILTTLSVVMVLHCALKIWHFYVHTLSKHKPTVYNSFTAHCAQFAVLTKCNNTDILRLC